MSLCMQYRSTDRTNSSADTCVQTFAEHHASHTGKKQLYLGVMSALSRLAAFAPTTKDMSAYIINPEVQQMGKANLYASF